MEVSGLGAFFERVTAEKRGLAAPDDDAGEPTNV
jgi:hypothetical protein